jgi:Zn finger protein HypA/HybF involved in hydrogenase expression
MPGEACCTDPRTGLPVHDRLDLKQNSMEFTSQQCGSINRETEKPDYCCYKCPTIREKILRGEEI